MLLCMRAKRLFTSSLIGAALLLGPAAGWCHRAADESGAKQDAKTAGHDTKKAAKATEKGVKKGATKTIHGTKKVFHKTKTTTTGAVSGGKEGAKQ